MTHTGLFQSPTTIISKVVLKKSVEKLKRSCYETMESHGEVLSSSSLWGRKTCGEQHYKTGLGFGQCHI